MTILSDKQLDEIRAREQAATKGPFEPDYDHEDKRFLVKAPDESIVASVYNSYGFRVLSDYGTDRSNAHFFAHARQDIPDLLDTIAALKKKLEEAKGALKDVPDVLGSSLRFFQEKCPKGWKSMLTPPRILALLEALKGSAK